jgi:excisionase family DNA binding protein
LTDGSITRFLPSIPTIKKRKEKAMADEIKDFYSVKELAEVLSVSQRTIFRLMERGDLPYYEIGRAKRFRKSDVEAYLEGQKRGGKT